METFCTSKSAWVGRVHGLSIPSAKTRGQYSSMLKLSLTTPQ